VARDGQSAASGFGDNAATLRERPLHFVTAVAQRI
jgi:hypothetical protein